MKRLYIHLACLGALLPLGMQAGNSSAKLQASAQVHIDLSLDKDHSYSWWTAVGAACACLQKAGITRSPFGISSKVYALAGTTLAAWAAYRLYAGAQDALNDASDDGIWNLDTREQLQALGAYAGNTMNVTGIAKLAQGYLGVRYGIPLAQGIIRLARA